jgi:hypothetical protein
MAGGAGQDEGKELPVVLWKVRGKDSVTEKIARGGSFLLGIELITHCT